MKTEFEELFETINDRKTNPEEGSYTAYLFDKGVEKICKKVGEEATETIIAAIKDDKEELVCEISDVIYHLFVLMVDRGVTLQDVENELAKRSLKKGNLKTERKPVTKY